MSEYSREKIKLRMLKRVAILWEIPDIEHVDPVVRLLIEALAEEVFILSGEIDNMDDRLLSKLSASMTPVTYLTARPAHAVLSALPVEATVTIDRNTLFEYKESKLLRRYNLNRIRFAPITRFELARAKIQLLNIENRLYRCSEECRKTVIGYTQKNDEKFNRSVWIGIEVSSEIEFLEDFSFYFDFMNVEDKSRYLQLLPYTRWSILDKEIEFAPGLPRDHAQTAMKCDYREKQTNAILSDLRTIYDRHYITLREIATNLKENYPKDWADYYSEDILTQCTTPLLWIKVTFPSSVPSEVLDHLRVGINLFPVANMSKRTTVQKMTDVSMFMPLDTGRNECFMEIESVTDSSGKIYESLSSDNYQGENKAKGTYSLRRGGVEQYSNTSDTKSAILRLTDIIRDRSLFSNGKAQAEFHQMVNDMFVSADKISNIAKTLNEQSELKSYIIVDKSNSGESLIADYWVTNGDAINGFKPTIPLSPDEHYSSAFEENISFLTSVQGGLMSPAIDQIKDIHRYILTSHDRIFTNCDVRNFCRAEYGQYIDSIEIKQGVAIGKRPHQGLIKTIDVHIISSAAHLSDLSVESFKSDLECKLSSRSPESFNYRIFINT